MNFNHIKQVINDQCCGTVLPKEQVLKEISDLEIKYNEREQLIIELLRVINSNDQFLKINYENIKGCAGSSELISNLNFAKTAIHDHFVGGKHDPVQEKSFKL